MNKLTNNIKATATATVVNGVASTNNITYNEQLTPGQTYAINAEYLQNDNFLYETGVGELEILKLPTTTTISGNNSIDYGQNVTLTIIVKDQNNQNITQGYITVYDGNEIIQSNFIITGQTSTISFIPNTTGVHDVYVIYHDQQGVYNDSNSNHLSITVNKLTTNINCINDLEIYYGDTVAITGTLTGPNNALLSNQTVLLKDHNGVTIQTVNTNTNGEFSLTYSASTWDAHNNHIAIWYNGNNTQQSVAKSIGITLKRHDVTLTVADVTGYTDDEVEIVVDAVDENGDPVTEGTVTVELTSIPQCIMRINGDTFDLPYNYFVYTGDVTIDYGDGTVETYDRSAIHTYSTSGIHIVTFTGNITRLANNTSYSNNMKQNLIHVTIPSSVTNLYNSCFRDCSGLTSITIPSSVISLDVACFYNCSGLTSITIPDSVTSLGSACFYNCSGLTSITIPDSVTSLGSDCFYGCTNLNNITFEWTTSDTILSYNSNWSIPSTTTINIPQGTTSLYTDKGYPSSQLVEVQ